jgi:hypothetical protein
VPKQRLIRSDGLLAESVPLVRALFDSDPVSTVFDRRTLIGDAEFNFTEFGYHGLSVWCASTSWPMESVLEKKARRARRVAVFRAGDLYAVGLSLVPSGKQPHYDIALGDVYGTCYGGSPLSSGTAAELVERYLAAPYAVIENNHYQEPRRGEATHDPDRH